MRSPAAHDNDFIAEKNPLVSGMDDQQEGCAAP
jgi:hypothetical protein